jgi:predicted phage terminase large subunit-like protein
LISIDAAFKETKNSDFVSIQVWGKRNADMYLLDNDTRRMDFPKTVQAIRDIRARYPNVRQILIEDKANGSAIISTLRHEIPGIIPILPQGGKVSRVNAVSHAIESHNVWLPRIAPWVDEFIEECAAFPTGKHDDQVDAMSQALNRMLGLGAHIAVNLSARNELDPFKLFARKDKGVYDIW